MNNKYQHVEKPLTASIARELIHELFAGQTVPRREIVRVVDEKHLERGGHPSVSNYHPVTRTLSTMKQSGLAKNPRLGFWYILPYIKTLNGFIHWVSQFDSGEDEEDTEKYLFRGVSSVDYKIDASAYRRLKKGRDSDKRQKEDFERFLQINRDMISDARFRGHGYKDGRRLEDLEILAEFQHYGAATCLIDFTYNALVALWFACKKSSQNASKDGKVVAVQPSDTTLVEFAAGFSVITLKSLEKKIDDFFRDSKGNVNEKLYQWQPRHQNNRITAQQSIFLFGVLEMDPEQKCFIDENSKERIRESLKRIYGITEDMLFPDFDGFARQHSQDVPYTLFTASQYKERGDRLYQRGDYAGAITDFDMAIGIDPNDAETYYARGRAKFHHDQHEAEAIADYDEAIRLKPDYAEAYYHSGLANYELGRDIEAIADFDMAINSNLQDAEVYKWRGVVKAQRMQQDEAIADFDMAIDRDPDDAETYSWRGIMRAQLGKPDEAIADFDDAIRLAPEYVEAYFNRGLMKRNIQQFTSAIRDFDRTIALQANHAFAYYHRAEAKYRLSRLASAKVDLEIALPLAVESDNDEFIAKIEELLYEINSRTAGGTEDE